MKIRLTESELVTLIKKIIKEENTTFDDIKYTHPRTGEECLIKVAKYRHSNRGGRQYSAVVLSDVYNDGEYMVIAELPVTGKSADEVSDFICDNLDRTFEILDEKGRPRQFGSVAGGGRYDDLVKRFTGQSVPATGVSIGVDRLLAALRAKGRAGGETAGPVVVTVMDRDRMADYMAMAAELRRAGMRAEVYLGNPKNFGNQLKYADKRASPVAVIQGSSEAEKGTVILKDLVLGARIAAGASLEEWKQRPAQREILRAELVAAVRQMLD
jgi:hypothetical protein